MEEIRSRIIDWGVTTRPLAGEEQSGDAFVVQAWGNKVLLAAIDGLGHGAHAASAARIAVETLIGHAQDSDDVVSLVRRCHESLLRTRGVVLSLALFDAAKKAMTWLGVGNVDGLLLQARNGAERTSESLLRRGGVVGYQLPSLRPSTILVNRGDLLIFATDGILSGFEEGVNPEDSPQQIADMIMTNYNRKTDDALVLAARYIEGES